VDTTGLAQRRNTTPVIKSGPTTANGIYNGQRVVARRQPLVLEPVDFASPHGAVLRDLSQQRPALP
jgi:hypothetical protein